MAFTIWAKLKKYQLAYLHIGEHDLYKNQFLMRQCNWHCNIKQVGLFKERIRLYLNINIHLYTMKNMYVYECEKYKVVDYMRVITDT